MPKFWAWLRGLQNVQPNDANTKKVGGFTLSSPSNRKASISENKAETRPTFRTNPSHRTIITFKTWNTSHLHPLWELPCSIRHFCHTTFSPSFSRKTVLMFTLFIRDVYTWDQQVMCHFLYHTWFSMSYSLILKQIWKIPIIFMIRDTFLETLKFDFCK